MRLLHTSDWHLGRTFHGASLLDDQAAAVDRIVALAAEHQVELVVIAGDLFDRAIAPAGAVALFDDALARLHATGATVAAIAGNHDSATRVAVNDRLLNALGVAVRGDPARLAEPLVLERPRDGGPPVAVYLVPYLEPLRALDVLGDDEGEVEGGRATHHRVTALATARARAHHATLGDARSVLVAHTFVQDGATSSSERHLSVGDIDTVALDAFAGFHYVALGHLHRPQAFDDGRVAYSGTPLPYSFSEEGQEKSVRIVDVAPDGSLDVTVEPLGVGRALATLTGTLDALLGDPAHQAHEDAWVRARITDAELPVQAMAKLRTRFPHAVELSHQPAGAGPVGAADIVPTDQLRQLAPIDLALRFWEDQQGMAATDAQRDLLAAALAHADEGSDP